MNTSKKQRAAERRAVVERLQREQKARERRRAILGGSVVAVILLAIAGGVAFSITQGHKSGSGQSLDVAAQRLPTTPTGSTTVQTKPKTVKNPTSIPGVVAYDTGNWPGSGASVPGALAHDHVNGPVTYAVTPPVGGPHNPIWMNAGVYTKPVPPERAVHNLEHGAIWITYRPDLPASQVTALVDLFKRQSMIAEGGTGASNRFMDLSPWSSNALPAPIVVSSWGYQLKVQSPSDPRIQQFIDTFRHSQKYTPEYGSAVDGIPSSTGGVPALSGSSKPSL